MSASGSGGSGGTGGSSSTPSGWVQWTASEGGNDHWYGIRRGVTDWESARTSAAALSSNAYLATITSAEEQAFIASTFLTGDDGLRVFWIGASAPAGDRMFAWLTGEAFEYVNWKSGEPNNWTGDEFYTCINWNAVRGPIGEWNDVPLTGTEGYDAGANDGPYEALVESEVLPSDM